jgi:type I restriction enzyme M protein
MTNISNLVKTIQNIMRKDAGTYGDAQRLEQLGWMFFLKIFDDHEKELEVLRDDYKSPLPQDLRWSAWASDAEGITGDALLEFVDIQLLPKLKGLTGGAGDKLTTLIRTTFEDANNYMKNGTLMRQVANKINCIDFNASDDRHMFGDIYEKLLKDLQSAGNAGEFYTPRAVTQFIVEQVNPRLGETILDPACGTGGFLVNAIEHLRKQAKTEEDEQAIQECFAGIEKKHLPHVLCMTNLLLHGIDVPSNVRHDNTLARPLRDWGPKERVDVIVTNPPFGGMEEDGIESNYPAEFRTRETADLFLVLLMKILKPGGRAGLVLPDGTLFGEGVKTRIKEALLTECNLHTIVRLPNGVFNPYTGIRTNLLFFIKGAPTTHVWYYEHPYPPGAKSYNKGKPIRIEEFEGERAWWGSEKDGFKSRVGNEQAWRVSIDQIKAGNFNLDLKNPHNSDIGPGDVDHLLPEYEKLLAQIAATRAALKQELHQGLQNRRVAIETLFEKSELFADAPNAVARMRELVLELALRGKLVAQNVADEPASELLKRVHAEKIRRKGRIEFSDEEESTSNTEDFEIPANWEWVGATTPAVMVSDQGKKIQTKDILDSGKYPVVDQGKVFIRGYCNDSDRVISVAEPIVLFGDHTRETKLIDFDFVVGADGVKLLQPVCIDPRFYFLALRWLPLESRGYARHFKLLKASRIPIPPLAEQRRIVAKVEQLMALVDQLETQLHASRTTAANFLEALLAKLTGWRRIPSHENSPSRIAA